ncbi:MAG TPA: PqiC family protein [Verrucomicrobiae bacterium]|nr:PqiC family protein [Verrucomicrobiae bacterium]
MKEIWTASFHCARVALPGLLVFAAGCAALHPVENNSRLYLLTATAASNAAQSNEQQAQKNETVLVRPVGIADFLKTKSIAVKTGSNELFLTQSHRWAEPLDLGIRRVLVEDLRRLVANPILIREPLREPNPARSISVQVTEFGAVRHGNGYAVGLSASWQFLDQRSILARGQFNMPRTAWDGKNYDELARNLSRGLGDLAEEISRAIAKEPSNGGGV